MDLTPKFLKIQSVHFETESIATLDIDLEHFPLPFEPGQFNMLYAFGVGESAISISGSPHTPSKLIHTIRNVGPVTNHLVHLKPGDPIGVRGPFGAPWPIKKYKGHDVILLAGGIGLAPLRPVIYEILENRSDYNDVFVLYGARNPRDLIFVEESKSWKDRIHFLTTVDTASRDWTGAVGTVTHLMNQVKIDPHRCVAMVCGPEVMMRFSQMSLSQMGLSDDHIFLSLERSMKCALGFCGHCQFGPHFICKDGPVLPASQVIQKMKVREL